MYENAQTLEQNESDFIDALQSDAGSTHEWETLDETSTNSYIVDDYELLDNASTTSLSELTRLHTGEKSIKERPQIASDKPNEKIRNDGINFLKWLLTDIKVMTPKQEIAVTHEQAKNHKNLFSAIIKYDSTREVLLKLIDSFSTHGLNRAMIANKSQYFRLKQEYTHLLGDSISTENTQRIFYALNAKPSLKKYLHTQAGNDFQQVTRTLAVDIALFCIQHYCDTDYKPSNKVITQTQASPLKEYFAATSTTLNVKVKKLAPSDIRFLNALLDEYFTIRDKLITHNMPLVIKLARNRASSEMAASELIQEGVSGLIRAAEKYENTKGTRFSTYAFNWIESKIRAASINDTSIIKLSPEVYIEMSKLFSAQDLLTAQGESVTDKKVSAIMDVSLERVQWLQKINRNTLSFQHINDQGSNAGLENKLPHLATTLDEAHKIHRNERLMKTMAQCLAAREQNIMALRYGLTGQAPQTIEAIGKIHQLSSERIRQLELQSIERLRKSFNSQGWTHAEG